MESLAKTYEEVSNSFSSVRRTHQETINTITNLLPTGDTLEDNEHCTALLASSLDGITILEELWRQITSSELERLKQVLTNVEHTVMGADAASYTKMGLLAIEATEKFVAICQLANGQAMKYDYQRAVKEQGMIARSKGGDELTDEFTDEGEYEEVKIEKADDLDGQ